MIIAEDAGLKTPAGVVVLSIIEILWGVWLIFGGTGYVIEAIWKLEAWELTAFASTALHALLYFGAGIAMIYLGRGFARLDWWSLWGSIVVIAAIAAVIILDPFNMVIEYLGVWQNLVVIGVFFAIIYYLMLPSIRGKFAQDSNRTF